MGVSGSLTTNLSDNPVNKVHVTLGPILLVVNELITEYYENFYSNHYSYATIRSQFCTCHDSSVVMACAKLWPDHYCSQKSNTYLFTRLWAHKLFMKWIHCQFSLKYSQWTPPHLTSVGKISCVFCQLKVWSVYNLRNNIWWLCLVPTSTTRFASDVGCRMAKI